MVGLDKKNLDQPPQEKDAGSDEIIRSEVSA